ncbi:MAG: hypothetical protein JWO30_4597 [Fibrobacteres bacterium]|nr:hypothetical protein [Fibrobacterota bacterium]
MASTLRRIGLISDTHGLLRPEALELLRGSDLIVHAGDIGGKDGKGGREILAALRDMAPVAAIRGNNDTQAWARGLPERKSIRVNGDRVHILHDVHDLAFDPAARGIRCVVAGHSHQPSVEERNGVLFVNPGSAGPRRFTLPVTLARIEILKGRWRAVILPIAIP